MKPSLRASEAARALNVSYATLKQWIYKKKIRSVPTPGGHHRIPRREIERLSADASRIPELSEREVGIEAISGRNKLAGTVTGVKQDGLLAEVEIDVGGQILTAIITRASVRRLGLKRGSRAFALIKATEVMVIRD
jgi:molybdopterin-binding protein